MAVVFFIVEGQDIGELLGHLEMSFRPFYICRLISHTLICWHCACFTQHNTSFQPEQLDMQHYKRANVLRPADEERRGWFNIICKAVCLEQTIYIGCQSPI